MALFHITLPDVDPLLLFECNFFLYSEEVIKKGSCFKSVIVTSLSSAGV